MCMCMHVYMHVAISICVWRAACLLVLVGLCRVGEEVRDGEDCEEQEQQLKAQVVAATSNSFVLEKHYSPENEAFSAHR